MGLNRDIESLTPETEEMAREFLSRCERIGLKVRVSEALRTPETQAVYYLRGRINTQDPNILRALQILGSTHAWKFSAKEAGMKITWTLDSNHLDGNAIDIVVYKKDGKVTWNLQDDEWKTALEIARDVGFTCGADWPAPHTDGPHLENRG
jgi:hypothetical protein